ncbi:6,7-dimethyl-8-ribityllumazine synthase [Blastomyces dermatitidis ER-3]|uniref:6,7-dimethyl-8-ribityllumazine synthase n=3 Tax=Blastomyces TaxID=229219 RepID=A0A179UDQ4_BLAGS|nr:6,7-dimethyl-8-ribityllumazine synthase [Blastomyces gilchristii SLH14081]XP_045275797.1 6,7-dimethyl-8-ribityllumazine synthase [Blastomyces dermatitidis ER-3]EEQ88729.1 6,7-dimethyl-8-ribityllumazine synthase [Blastomyces dermatitidis ER-3]OAT05287.1 6,7-dimethyl-8-ribityllumazine synthase [Blastomyces gilchristii SLH14081]
MSTALKGPGTAEVHDGSNLRIAIVHARWNDRIIHSLVDGAKKALLAAGVAEGNIVTQSVPGSWELPVAVETIYTGSVLQATKAATPCRIPGTATADTLSATAPPPTRTSIDTPTSSSPVQTPASTSASSQAPFDALIAIGVLIKGETMHFEYIADAVSNGLMRLQIEKSVPVIFGLLTVLTEEQGLVRAGLADGKGSAAHNHGEDWGRAAVELGVKRRGWAEGRFL